MNNNKIRISSSIISFLIVVLGFFMLCMSRAPQINIDEPLIDGGGVKSEGTSDADEDLASLLDESEESSAASSDSDQATSEDDEALLSLFDEKNSSTKQNDRSAAVGDEGMDEILRLLEEDDSADSDNNLDWLAGDESTKNSARTTSPANQPVTTSKGPGAIDEMQQEVRRLESVLASKTSEMEHLRSEVQSYDKQIAKLESRGNYGASSTPVRYASATKRVAQNRSEYAEDQATAEPKAVSPTLGGGNFEAKYNAAVELYNRQEYPQAIERFYQLLQSNPNHALAEHWQYWIGECRFAQGNYYQAIAEFSKVFAYETPDKQDDAQLMLGLAFLKLGQINNARSEFDWLVSCYSSSEYSKTANAYLSRF